MTRVELPALDGRSPLGALAAYGLLRLLVVHAGIDARLSWSHDHYTAVLDSPLDSIEDIVAALNSIVESIVATGLVPGLPASFPPSGGSKDRLRVDQRDLVGLHGDLATGLSSEQAGEMEAWLGSLVTDLGRNPDGRVAISQYTAPAGKQQMATMLDKPLACVVANPDYLFQALRGWRRVPGVTGEYLDHRAMFDGTDAMNGVSEMRGVPGATWLALMSFPLFRTSWSIRNRRSSSGWHSFREGRRWVEELRLPMWQQPVGPAGVIALVEHPALALLGVNHGVGPRRVSATTSDSTLEALGVFHVCRARRRRLPNSDGPLAPLA